MPMTGNPEDHQFHQDAKNEEDLKKWQHLDANAYQIAMLNKMLPKGFKFDLHELVVKA
jgi:hypothetical protein